MLDVDQIAEKALALEAEDKAKGDATSEDEGEDGEKAIAANEVFDAVKDGDRKGFRTALEAYVQICLAKQGMMDEDDDY